MADSEGMAVPVIGNSAPRAVLKSSPPIKTSTKRRRLGHGAHDRQSGAGEESRWFKTNWILAPPFWEDCFCTAFISVSLTLRKRASSFSGRFLEVPGRFAGRTLPRVQFASTNPLQPTMPLREKPTNRQSYPIRVICAILSRSPHHLCHSDTPVLPHPLNCSTFPSFTTHKSKSGKEMVKFSVLTFSFSLVGTASCCPGSGCLGRLCHPLRVNP